MVVFYTFSKSGIILAISMAFLLQKTESKWTDNVSLGLFGRNTNHHSRTNVFQTNENEPAESIDVGNKETDFSGFLSNSVLVMTNPNLDNNDETITKSDLQQDKKGSFPLADLSRRTLTDKTPKTSDYTPKIPAKPTKMPTNPIKLPTNPIKMPTKSVISKGATSKGTNPISITKASSRVTLYTGSVNYDSSGGCRCAYPGESIFNLDTLHIPYYYRATNSSTSTSKSKGANKGTRSLTRGDSSAIRAQNTRSLLHRRQLTESKTSKSSKTSKTSKSSKSSSTETSNLDVFPDGKSILPHLHPACRNVRFICPGTQVPGPLWSYSCLRVG